MSAFEGAARFLQTGLVLLDGKDKWATHYDLSFQITESLAQMQLINGRLDECKATAGEALLRGNSLEMKIPSLLLMVKADMAGNKMDEFILSAEEALETLGVKLPRRVGKLNVILMVIS
jgi:hypothetical protein